MSAITRLWLVRHGETAAPQGFTPQFTGPDVGLSDTGRAQAIRAAAYLRNEPISGLYSSPLARATECAEIMSIEMSLPVVIVPELREIDFGDFAGLSRDEVIARFPNVYGRWTESPAEVRFPNGEGLADVRARVILTVETICKERQGQDAVIVCHSGVIRTIIAWALRMPDECIFRLSQGHAAINRLTFLKGFPCVDLMNYCPQ